MGDKPDLEAVRWPALAASSTTGRNAEAVHMQMCKLTAWFVHHIPYTSDGSAFAIDHHHAFATRCLDDILADLFDMNYGGTCAALSLFMAAAARRAGYDAIELNFGDNQFESHVLVLVSLSGGEQVFYDPTFGCFSGTADGKRASVRAIIDLLRQGKGGELRWVDLGLRERRYLFADDEAPQLPLTSSIRQLDERRRVAMIDLKFHACTTWNAIWQWARSQTLGLPTVFDCLRFPLSTSGEVEAEALAETLRSIR